MDVVPPVIAPSGKGVEACTTELMPWSAFPCSYDPTTSYGIPGQPVSYCYNVTNGTGPRPAPVPEPGFDESLATSLTTDGYNNIYIGRLPERALCGPVNRAGSSIIALHLVIEFRIASGRQFDRTYTMQLGDAVAAFGTLSEPWRGPAANKTWTIKVDVTYLGAYLKPGMPTLFSLSNVLSNTYNVPLWARARLEVYSKKGYSSPKPVAEEAKPSAAAWLSLSAPGVPDEVLPLLAPGTARGPYAYAVYQLDGSGTTRCVCR